MPLVSYTCKLQMTLSPERQNHNPKNNTKNMRHYISESELLFFGGICLWSFTANNTPSSNLSVSVLRG